MDDPSNALSSPAIHPDRRVPGVGHLSDDLLTAFPTLLAEEQPV